MEFNSDLRARFLGHALGFTVVSHGRPPTEGDVPLPEFQRRARSAIARSGVLILGPTPRWKLYTTWPEDIERCLLPHRCSNLECLGNNDSPVRMYLLSPNEPALTRAEATREALKFAAASALGRVESQYASFGTALYDRLLMQVQGSDSHFCPAEGGNGESCLRRRACRTHSACLSAGNFLRRATRFVPDLRDNPNLLVAAQTFDSISKELSIIAATRALCMDGPSDLPERLRRIRQLHERAADHLDGLSTVL
jgi:hypothetical protein